MGGKGSGRKPLSQEMLKHQVIQKAWMLTDERLSNPEDAKRYDTAEALAVRDMTQKQQVDSRVEISEADKAILDRYIQGNRLAN